MHKDRKEFSDLMSKNEIDALNSMNKIKYTVFSIIEPEKILEILKESVEESNLVGFRSERDKRISLNKITLTLKLDKEAILNSEKYHIDADEYNQDSIDLITLVHEEIFTPFNRKLGKLINDNKEGIKNLDRKYLDNTVFNLDRIDIDNLEDSEIIIDMASNSVMSNIILTDIGDGDIIAKVEYMN